MHRLHYTGTVFTTGSTIAHAVLEYAAELAKAQLSAAVTIPVRTDDAGIRSAELLLGPSSQIVAEPVETDGAPELEDETLVAQLTHATRTLTPHPSATLPADVATDIDDYPWSAHLRRPD